VLLLAAALALESADLATIGAVGSELERSLGISHGQLGLLASAGSIAGALATLPMGVLADRVTRARLLAASVAVWAVAMLASGAAGSFTTLLMTRVGLGAVTATAGPVIASLVGDAFSPGERGRIYGLIGAGEMAGSGFGFLVSGSLGGLLSWRWAFWVLVPPAVVLAVALWRRLPEPPRGGAEPARDPPEPGPGDRSEHARVRELVRERGIEPAPDRVAVARAAGRSLPAALRFVLSVRTNVLLLITAAVGHFFFAGVRTFTVVFIRGHYGLRPALATLAVGALGIGAFAGVIAGGRLADRLLGRGVLDARIVVAAVAMLVTPLLWVTPLLTTSLALGLGVGVVAATAMNIANAPIDAARIDVVPSRLRGRAESIRSLLRAGAFAIAPVLFGRVADALGSHRDAVGVRDAFLVMLVALAAAGGVLLLARRSYPRDVATAIAADQRDPGDGPAGDGADAQA
jgi:MFS family permease